MRMMHGGAGRQSRAATDGRRGQLGAPAASPASWFEGSRRTRGDGHHSDPPHATTKIIESQLCKTAPGTQRLPGEEGSRQLHHSHTSTCCALVAVGEGTSEFDNGHIADIQRSSDSLRCGAVAACRVCLTGLTHRFRSTLFAPIRDGSFSIIFVVIEAGAPTALARPVHPACQGG